MTSDEYICDWRQFDNDQKTHYVIYIDAYSAYLACGRSYVVKNMQLETGSSREVCRACKKKQSQ